MTDPSDIPRLRSTHSTAGYRNGISIAKERSLQPGFDEGYSLGAVFGLRIGYILGTLEGLWCAYSDPCAERLRLGEQLRKARDALRIDEVFGKEWWGMDGIWRYEVQVDGAEATFEEVVCSHPLMGKWMEQVEKEIEKAGLRKDKFEGIEWEKGRLSVGTN